MIPTNRTLPHPGEILLEEYLRPMDISQRKFAEHIGVSTVRLNELIQGKRGVTADTAWRLSQALGTSPELWMNLQAQHDLTKNRPATTIQKLSTALDDSHPGL